MLHQIPYSVWISWQMQFNLNLSFIFFSFFFFTVILARILRKSVQKVKHNNVFKIEIRKAYKVWMFNIFTLCTTFVGQIFNRRASLFLSLPLSRSLTHFVKQKSPHTDQYLRDGRIITPATDSMCGGLDLKVGRLYMIAGNSSTLTICNYVKEYSQMTIVERRGFSGGYKKGCACQVRFDYSIFYPKKNIETNYLSTVCNLVCITAFVLDWANVSTWRIPSIDWNM